VSGVIQVRSCWSLHFCIRGLKAATFTVEFSSRPRARANRGEWRRYTPEFSDPYTEVLCSKYIPALLTRNKLPWEFLAASFLRMEPRHKKPSLIYKLLKSLQLFNLKNKMAIFWIFIFNEWDFIINITTSYQLCLTKEAKG